MVKALCVKITAFQVAVIQIYTDCTYVIMTVPTSTGQNDHSH